MNIVKIQLKWACRIEHLSASYYDSLSRRYRKKEDISQALEHFSKDEYRHGVMFGQAFQEEYGKKLMIWPWAVCGKVLAFSQILVPMRWKLKVSSAIEYLAVVLMDRELRSGKSNRYRAICREIKPDEERHAAYYSQLYLAKS